MDWATAEVPWHRVQEIRYRNQILWDRKTRTYHPDLLLHNAHAPDPDPGAKPDADADAGAEAVDPAGAGAGASTTRYHKLPPKAELLAILNQYVPTRRKQRARFYLCGSRGLDLPNLEPATDYDFLYVGSYWHEQEQIKRFLMDTGLFSLVHRVENPNGLILKARSWDGTVCEFQFWNPTRSREKDGTPASNMLTEPKYWLDHIPKPAHGLYKESLAFIKNWAKAREIYGQSYGFLSGMSWNLLVTFIWIREKESTPSLSCCTPSLRQFLRLFFETYADWDWSESSVGLLKDQSYQKQQAADYLMCILLATAPRENTVRTMPQTTRDITVEEFRRARQIFKNDTDPMPELIMEMEPDSESFRFIYDVVLVSGHSLEESASYLTRFIPQLLVNLSKTCTNFRPRTKWVKRSAVTSVDEEVSWSLYSEGDITTCLGTWLNEHKINLPKSVRCILDCTPL